MRDRIVQAAADPVFAAGSRETTLDHVRSAVGASMSQLYHYFGDTDELVHGVIDFQGARIISAQQPELAAIDSDASLTREALGWKPTHPRLLEDLENIQP
jgi:AcrR family transcriptional regulator